MKAAILFSLALIGLTNAIPCDKVPWDKALDPNAAKQGGWEIVHFQQCYVRAQNALDKARGGNGTYWDSRVTKLQWRATTGSVVQTVSDPFNTDGRNEQLWFEGDLDTFGYWGCTNRCPIGSAVQSGMLDPHKSSSGDMTVISLVLPSSTRKLRKIIPDPHLRGPNPEDFNREAEGAKNLGIFGINGDINNDDIAWGNMWLAYTAFRARDRTQKFFPAERADKNKCVIVDLTNLR